MERFSPRTLLRGRESSHAPISRETHAHRNRTRLERRRRRFHAEEEEQVKSMSSFIVDQSVIIKCRHDIRYRSSHRFLIQSVYLATFYGVEYLSINLLSLTSIIIAIFNFNPLISKAN